MISNGASCRWGVEIDTGHRFWQRIRNFTRFRPRRVFFDKMCLAPMSCALYQKSATYPPSTASLVTASPVPRVGVLEGLGPVCLKASIKQTMI